MIHVIEFADKCTQFWCSEEKRLSHCHGRGMENLVKMVKLWENGDKYIKLDSLEELKHTYRTDHSYKTLFVASSTKAIKEEYPELFI